MASIKRKYDEDDTLFSNKSRSRPSVEAKVDPTYGQRSAIPGLDDETVMEGEDSDLNYNDEMDALAYLRAVRQEATGIPNLLVAPKDQSNDHNLYEDSVGDFRGRYEDGAYVAATQFDEAHEEESEALQKAYFDSILARYNTLRMRLNQTPPPELVEQLDSDHPVHLGIMNKQTARWWVWHLKKVHPIPAQIASMDKSTVLRLLGLITQGTMLKVGLKSEVCLSQWVSSLLARLPERGYLTSEEIGVVRELGKKAVLVGISMKQRQEWRVGLDEVEAGMEGDFEEDEIVEVHNEDEIELDMEDDDYIDKDSTNGMPKVAERVEVISRQPEAETSANPGLDSLQRSADTITQNGTEDVDDMEAIKARLLGRMDTLEVAFEVSLEPEIILEPILDDKSVAEDGTTEAQSPTDAEDPPTKWNTQATVDMILTVAGEAYGQRDLLEFRGNWSDTL